MVSRNVVSRSGASLLEVLIASAILLVSIAALTSQALVGVRAAKRAQLQTLANVICRSVLAEQAVLSKLSSTPARRVPGLEDWMVQTRVESLSDAKSIIDQNAAGSLSLLSVTAWQPGINERLSKTTLSQIVRHPHVSGGDLLSSLD